MEPGSSLAAVSFDCLGTLVAVDRPDDWRPAAAVATALDERGVPVPDGWADAVAEADHGVVTDRRADVFRP